MQRFPMILLLVALAVRPILEDEHGKKTKPTKGIESDSSLDRRQELEDLDWTVIKQLSRHLDRKQLNEYCNLPDEEAKARQRGGPGRGGVSGGAGGGVKIVPESGG
ncbi:hypothetical protein [Pseudodesulfovibrio sp.]|uniref:hypothetical protein n=1 Tax=Pseudodesulfovibrio sp. TaxID=2035812 RepID=UPI002603710F|nr:hypothetical protein [Pseudodesulfovibrio sp.]MDD3311163.1 hypothetical protein [Pseudodesulfovibrio sp.]